MNIPGGMSGSRSPHTLHFGYIVPANRIHCQLNGSCFNKSVTAEPVTLWIWLSSCRHTKNIKSNPSCHPVSKDNNQWASGLVLCGRCWQMGCFILMDHLSLTMPSPPCSYAAAGNNNNNRKKIANAASATLSSRVCHPRQPKSAAAPPAPGRAPLL